MSACDTDNFVTRHSDACRRGLGRRCRKDWCRCACHDGMHRSVAARTGRAQPAASERAADELDRLLADLAASGQWFSAATVRPLLPPGLSDGQIGGAFVRARTAGLIEPVRGELRQTAHESGHSRAIRVWRGTAQAKSQEER